MPYFLIASLVLHLLLLLGLNSDRPTTLLQAPASPMRAEFSTRGQQIVAPEPPVERLRHLARPNEVSAKPAKRLLAESETSTLRSEAPPSAAPPPVPIGETATTVEEARPSLPREAVDANTVRQYLLLLVPEARRLKRYPPLARERGWEGTVEITVKLGRGQVEPVVVVTRSSGFPVLDEQALSTIGQAVRLVAVPAALRDREVGIAVPVRFSLQD